MLQGIGPPGDTSDCAAVIATPTNQNPRHNHKRTCAIYHHNTMAIDHLQLALAALAMMLGTILRPCFSRKLQKVYILPADVVGKSRKRARARRKKDDSWRRAATAAALMAILLLIAAGATRLSGAPHPPALCLPTPAPRAVLVPEHANPTANPRRTRRGSSRGGQ